MRRSYFPTGRMPSKEIHSLRLFPRDVPRFQSLVFSFSFFQILVFYSHYGGSALVASFESFVAYGGHRALED